MLLNDLPSSSSSSSSDEDNGNNESGRISNDEDPRFVCSICLDIVSSEPVVTPCGHLYCWACLYTWLQPGMTVDEYYTTFGTSSSSSSNNGGGGLRGGGFGRIPLDAHTPSYQARQQARRKCPVCKAGCTVDTVIPIYVNNIPPRGRHRRRRKKLRAAAAAVTAAEETTDNDIDDDNSNNNNNTSTTTPIRQSRQEGLETGDIMEYLEDETPIHRNTTAREYAETRSTPGEYNDDDRMNSPPRPTPRLLPRRIANNDDGRIRDIEWMANGGSSSNNSSSMVEGESVSSFSSASPFRLGLRSRRSPLAFTSASMTTTTTTTTTDAIPIISQRHTRDSSGEGRHIPSSREAVGESRYIHPEMVNAMSEYRRRPPPVVVDNADVMYRQNRQRRYFGGRLTSALLMIVDVVDDVLNSSANNSTAGGDGGVAGGGGGATTESTQLAIPSLHRPDGGLRQRPQRTTSEGGGVGGAMNEGEDALGRGYHNSSSNGMMRSNAGEDSSLLLAREFLSRLLLVLACFVLLCLLLF